eukprot:3660654-Amphidinium_carterae.1
MGMLCGFYAFQGESPQTILEHLLGGKLMPIAHAVDIRNVEKASEVRKSRHHSQSAAYQMPT